MADDQKLDVSIGKSRHDKNWRQHKLTWAELCERLSTTHRTHETHKEYVAADKERQAEIKDIGGFVGGLIRGGRRLKRSVIHRQLLTLDMDSPLAGMWADFCLDWPNAAAVYSTHKHSTGEPRLRLLMPLTRPVMSDEYEALARKVAEMIGIDQVDPSTYQPERLMYWPSTSSDGTYFYDTQDGPWLDPDQVLSLYHDWRDASQWPGLDEADKAVLGKIDKQGDPTTKPGILGAFCRVYSIEEAIDTYLSDVYEKTDDHRYTYKAGSTINGLVLYEDKYCYSHHGTDPASGKLCNAFDIVRIHKFGDLDVRSHAGTPINKLPSNEKMIELAAADKTVRRLIGEERLAIARQEFDILPDGDEEPGDGEGSDEQEGPNGSAHTPKAKKKKRKVKNTMEPPDVWAADTDHSWLEELEVDKYGNNKSTINNIVLILNNDPYFKNSLSYNAFTSQFLIQKRLPWRVPRDQYERVYTDVDDAQLRNYLENVYKIVNKGNIIDAVEIVFAQHAFHPVREYLGGLLWDGEPRVEALLIDFMGATDSHYVRQVTRKALTGAVARIMQPGVKFDYVLTLVGPQGAGKSTLFDRLAGQWFSDSFGSLQNNKAYENIQGVWIMEIGELAGLKRSEVEEVKHFLSKRVDTFRPAYGRKVVTLPRQCIFVGTTNTHDFLQDRTGNRRFWPVEIFPEKAGYDVKTELSQDIINQLWAEAVEIYEEGELLYLDAETEELASTVQSDFTEDYVHSGRVSAYLDRLLPDNWGNMSTMERRAYLDSDPEDSLTVTGTLIRNEVTVAEIWYEALAGHVKEFNRLAAKEIRDIMRSMPGWRRAEHPKRVPIYGLSRIYERVRKNKLQNS